MKTLLPLLLCALCAGAHALTMAEIAGRWALDLEATLPLMEELIRKQAPSDADAQQFATMKEEIKTRMSGLIMEFSEKTILSYQVAESIRGRDETMEITGVAAEGDKLKLTCKGATLTISKRGDRLTVVTKDSTGPDDPGLELAFVLKQAADTAKLPAVPALTIKDVLGRWVVDVEATRPLMMAQIRMWSRPGMSKEEMAMQVESFERNAATGCYEFTEKEVLIYDEKNGIRESREHIEIAKLASDQDQLVIMSEAVKLTLARRGDRLKMETLIGDPWGGGGGRSMTVIIKRAPAAATTPTPAPKP